MDLSASICFKHIQSMLVSRQQQPLCCSPHFLAANIFWRVLGTCCTLCSAPVHTAWTALNAQEKMAVTHEGFLENWSLLEACSYVMLCWLQRNFTLGISVKPFKFGSSGRLRIFSLRPSLFGSNMVKCLGSGAVFFLSFWWLKHRAMDNKINKIV